MARKKKVKGDLFRTIKVAMPHLPEVQFAKLIELRRDAGELWRSLVLYHRWIRGDRRPWPSMQDLAREMTGQTSQLGLSLGTQSQNLLFEEFLGNISAASEKRKKAESSADLAAARYPWRTRDAHDTHWDRRDVRYIPGIGIKLSLAKVPDPTTRSGLARQLPLLIPLKTGIPKNCTALTIHYDVNEGRFFILFKIKVKAKAVRSAATGQSMGIDLGQIRIAACVTQNGEALNIKGRGLRSIQQGHNKKKAFRSSRIARATKGSARRRKEVAKARRESRRVQRQVDNFLHTTSRRVIDFAAAHGVTTIYVGDAVRVRDRDVGKHQNQANSDWSIGKLEQQFCYKGEAKGIKVESINEAYTTRTCPSPNCGHVRKRASRGRVFCCPECQLEGHRDAVGAWNILVKGHVNATGSKPEFCPQAVAEATQTYLAPVGVLGVRRSPTPRKPTWSPSSAVQSRSPSQEGEARRAPPSTFRGTSPVRGCQEAELA